MSYYDTNEVGLDVRHYNNYVDTSGAPSNETKSGWLTEGIQILPDLIGAFTGRSGGTRVIAVPTSTNESGKEDKTLIYLGVGFAGLVILILLFKFLK